LSEEDESSFPLVSSVFFYFCKVFLICFARSSGSNSNLLDKRNSSALLSFRKYTRNEWKRLKTTLETSGEDGEKITMQNGKHGKYRRSGKKQNLQIFPF
jgi:hypothetical protein